MLPSSSYSHQKPISSLKYQNVAFVYARLETQFAKVLLATESQTTLPK